MVLLPTAGCSVLVLLVTIIPDGPIHSVVTVTRISTVVLNSTLQVILAADPTGRTGLSGTLVTVTLGDGTAQKEN